MPLITPQNRQPIYKTIAAKATELKSIAHAIGGIHDHVHLVATIPPSVSISQFIGEIKGSSSHHASRLITGHIDPFQWQAEYGVLSVSEKNLQWIIHYVLDQEQHHANNTLNKTLESIG